MKNESEKKENEKGKVNKAPAKRTVSKTTLPFFGFAVDPDRKEEDDKIYYKGSPPPLSLVPFTESPPESGSDSDGDDEEDTNYPLSQPVSPR